MVRTVFGLRGSWNQRPEAVISHWSVFLLPARRRFHLVTYCIAVSNRSELYQNILVYTRVVTYLDLILKRWRGLTEFNRRRHYDQSLLLH